MTVDIDEAKVERNEFGLWLGWTLATAIGMVLGYLPAALLVDNLNLAVARVVVPLLAGLLIGIAQWVVLRGYVTSSYDWILYHAGGWVLGYSLGLFILQSLSNSPVSTLLGFVLFGIIVAVFQWPLLRREIPHIIPWIIANVIGWTAGAYISLLVSSAIANSTHPNAIVNTLVTVGLTGLIAGAVIGLALVWIVRKPERTL